MANFDINLDEVKKLEEPFKGEGIVTGPTFEFGGGVRKLIITAPHSVVTSTKKIDTRDIERAILLAQEDEDCIFKRMLYTKPEERYIPASKDLTSMKKIMFEEEKRTISEIAKMVNINPYVLRWYFYKTAETERKKRENYTGAYAKYIAKLINCHYMVRYNNLKANANDNYLNRELIKYIAEKGILILLDLHGLASNPDFDYDIAVGTNRGEYVCDYETTKRIVTGSFLEEKIRADFETKWQASKERSLANQIYRYLRIDTMQLETVKELRMVISKPELAISMLNGLADCVVNLSEEKGKVYERGFYY
ncbi:MAG TPA: hypothetical protein PLX66_02645 [Bacilli bacterium]|nr:hypothetical protein [Bacilli bacterium]